MKYNFILQINKFGTIPWSDYQLHKEIEADDFEEAYIKVIKDYFKNDSKEDEVLDIIKLSFIF